MIQVDQDKQALKKTELIEKIVNVRLAFTQKQSEQKKRIELFSVIAGLLTATTLSLMSFSAFGIFEGLIAGILVASIGLNRGAQLSALAKMISLSISVFYEIVKNDAEFQKLLLALNVVSLALSGLMTNLLWSTSLLSSIGAAGLIGIGASSFVFIGWMVPYVLVIAKLTKNALICIDKDLPQDEKMYDEAVQFKLAPNDPLLQPLVDDVYLNELLDDLTTGGQKPNFINGELDPSSLKDVTTTLALARYKAHQWERLSRTSSKTPEEIINNLEAKTPEHVLEKYKHKMN